LELRDKVLAHTVCMVDCRFIIFAGTINNAPCSDLIADVVVELALSIVECECLVIMSESANAEAFSYGLTIEAKKKLVNVPTRERILCVV
jgi:hypothetical protein